MRTLNLHIDEIYLSLITNICINRKRNMQIRKNFINEQFIEMSGFRHLCTLYR